ncbi:hypothetical protein PVAP13_3NG117426 [Panicum virgatum]|uniref:Uncharacterized protein n=1 Tax=Panicum virgatum TaxID=38727 RepID=A0A8T0TR28_PANVG|nr:hypothetical protein PVAP13_3NG117426 [Panicum virgatum]
MGFAGWYLKIAAVGASIGAAMELFMIHTGFYEKVSVFRFKKKKLKKFVSKKEGDRLGV